MSELSYMDKLLDGVEVEWMALGKALVRTKGTNITAGRMKELHKDHAPLKIFAGGKTVAFVDFKDIPEKNINREPSIIVKSRGVVEFEYYTDPFSHKNEMWSYHSKNNNINIKYVYYYLKTKELYFQGLASRMQMPQIATPDTDKFQIPIPPLNVQAEIVRILDAFTELTAELIAELTAREQQYAYYQEELLSFEDDVEYEDLKEIAVFSQGIQVDTSKQFTEKSDSFVRFLRIVDFVKDSEPPRYIENPGDKYVKNEGDLVMIRYGARAAGKVFLKYDGAIANNMFQIKLTTPKITIAYLHCYLSQQKIYNFLNSNGGNSTMPAITFSQIGAVKIPIPTLAEQERIVAILDKFDTLTTSLTEGLPREIELRQQQYEYYRELLLSFPKLEGEA